MAWGSYYLFASAAEASKGLDLLLAENPIRYAAVYLDRTRIDGGERDAEGQPIMIDGPGHLLSVLDTQAPDPVPGWERAQVTSNQAGHTWANCLYEQQAMDEEAPATPQAITTASRPDAETLAVMREKRETRRAIVVPLHEMRARVDRVVDAIKATNERIQTKLPERRTLFLARITKNVARRAELVTARKAQADRARDESLDLEVRREAAELAQEIQARIESLDKKLAADRAWVTAYPDTIQAERDRRDNPDDGLAARLNALMPRLLALRTTVKAELAALEAA